MVLKIFGVIVLLVAAFFFFEMVMAAGGMHGLNEFRMDRVFDNRNGSAYYAGCGVLGLMLGAGLLMLGRKKRASASS
jgi:hypothetical protein